MSQAVALYASLLNADVTRLAEQVEALESSDVIAGLHVDVMDGHFVPNLAFGPRVVDGLRGITDLPLEVHLMVETPERYLGSFANAGSATLIVHAEATRHLHRVVQAVRELRCGVGVALNPATPLSAIEYVLDELDQVLIMGVTPGFGGQTLIDTTRSKVHACARLAEIRSRGTVISVDGGVKAENAALLARAGARQLVVGSALFGLAGVRSSCSSLAAALDPAAAAPLGVVP